MSGKTGQVSVIYCAEAFGKTIEPLPARSFLLCIMKLAMPPCDRLC
jgi:hypothetical protein